MIEDRQIEGKRERKWIFFVSILLVATFSSTQIMEFFNSLYYGFLFSRLVFNLLLRFRKLQQCTIPSKLLLASLVACIVLTYFLLTWKTIPLSKY